MSGPILSVKNLSVTLRNRQVIRDLSFEVQPRECLAIVGPNGSGKTVLLKTLLRLFPHGGEIRWYRDARLGYVPQKISADWHLPLKARDLLAAKARLLKLPAGEVDRVAAEVDLTAELLNTGVGELSGGQFQKMLIAFALLGQPNVLLVDEPTASLDELSEEHVYELVHSLQQKGLTILLVSHDLSVVYRYANMVLCLSKGHPCMGVPREVLTPEMLQDLYGAPSQYYGHIHEH